MAVFEVGRGFKYIQSSKYLRHFCYTKFQCKEATFDRCIRSCDILMSVSLPTIACVPSGAKGAVCQGRSGGLNCNIDILCNIYDCFHYI